MAVRCTPQPVFRAGGLHHVKAYGFVVIGADVEHLHAQAIVPWFDGTLKEYESGAIVRYNYNTITSCYWGGNAGQGVFVIMEER